MGAFLDCLKNILSSSSSFILLQPFEITFQTTYKKQITWNGNNGRTLRDRNPANFPSLHGAAPEYLRDCCAGTDSSGSGLRLRSLERTDLRVRRMKTHFGDRAFSAAGPRCWNSLPPVIRLADSVDSFKAQLKTHLFAKAYPS